MTSMPAAGGPHDPRDERLVRYLLGELPPDEAAAIDDALLDDDLWQALQLAEDELLDAQARGRLDPARAQRLAERIAASPRLRERVELHRGLQVIAQARERRARARTRVIRTAAVVLGMAAVLALFVAVRGRGGPGRAAGGEVVALALVPTTRAGGVPEVQLATAQALALSVVMDAEEAFSRYRVEIRSGGVLRWSQDDVIAAQGALALRVPVSALAEGVHELEITGIGPRGEAAKLGVRSFRVVR